MYAALEELQPYKGGNRVLLAALHHLDNLDKHRFPPVVASAGSVGSLNVESFQGYFAGPLLGALEDGAVVLEFIRQPDTDVDMEFEFAASIAFDQRSTVAAGQLVIPLLADIRNFVRNEVFPTFEPFL
jgi:hypothetical protein